jgi:hypothetical protein
MSEIKIYPANIVLFYNNNRFSGRKRIKSIISFKGISACRFPDPFETGFFIGNHEKRKFN